jgi:hypothetical protein
VPPRLLLSWREQNQDKGSGWIDVQFLRAATEQLVECRRALKYT